MIADAASLPPEPPYRRIFEVSHAICLIRLGQFEEAERKLIENHDAFVATLGPNHRWTASAASALQELDNARKKPALATQVHDEAPE